jgi:hypothetical protein
MKLLNHKKINDLRRKMKIIFIQIIIVLLIQLINVSPIDSRSINNRKMITTLSNPVEISKTSEFLNFFKIK